MRDFTLNMYSKLLGAFIDSGYRIDCFRNYLNGNCKGRKIVILRHDVDRKPINALKMAMLENDFGIKASYYFRVVKESYDEGIIKKIAEMGHEIGYHYENLSEISKKNPQISQTRLPLRGTSGQVDVDYLIGRRHTRTDADIYPADFAGQKESSLREKKEFRDEFFELAIDDFRLNLEKLRKFYPIKTICMHGSPLSKWDNRLLWQEYNYRDFGIIAEPYFDIDFNEVLYLTDTGRKWDASSENIRDKVESKFDLICKSTFNVIEKCKKNELPNIVMINIHPQRWTDSFVLWIKELIWQNTKNVIKELILAR